MRRVFDPRKFRMYVGASGTWIYYDRVVLRDGRVVNVQPGKYMRVAPLGGGKFVVAFEDRVEEAGEKPDFDFDEPSCVVDSVTGFISKTVKMRCRLGIGGSVNTLYYGNVKVGEFTGYKDSVDVTFSYIDRDEAVMLGAGVAIGAGFLGYRSLRSPLGILPGLAAGLVLIGYGVSKGV